MKGIDSYQIGEHGTAQEDHVSPSGGILNAHFEFLRERFSFSHSQEGWLG
jgi:hypothetical protein